MRSASCFMEFLWLLLLLSLGARTLVRASGSGGGSGGIDANANAVVANNVLTFSYALQNWLDAGKRPCHDFHAHVCGRMLNGSQAQQDAQLRKKQQRFERFIAANNSDQLLDSEIKLKHFYASCRSARSADDLKSSFMYRQTGGWPAIDDSPLMQRRRFNVTKLDVLSAFHDVGAMYFFRHRIEIRSNRRIVHLTPDESLRYTLRKFEQQAEEVMHEYNADAGRARLVALEILSFERNRREIAKQQAATNSATNNNNNKDKDKANGDGDDDEDNDVTEYTYTEFKRAEFGNAGALNWDAYFKKIVGKPLRPNDTLVVKQIGRLRGYFGLLQNTTLTRLLNWLWVDYLMDKTSADCEALTERYFEPVYQHIAERASIDKVQMAQMYTELGGVYNDVLGRTHWIDEMSQMNSQQMLGRVLHTTLNGDSTLDADYHTLIITSRNFYRNLERVQRFVLQRQLLSSTRAAAGNANALAAEFMRVFLVTTYLLPEPQQSLSAPLNYALVAERFAEQQIAAGSSSRTPGAWRSTDSERDFRAFKRCLSTQAPLSASSSSSTPAVVAIPAASGGGSSGGAATANATDANNTLLKLLAQRQAHIAYERWVKQNPVLAVHIDSLLRAGSLKLTLQKLYFIGTLLSECRDYGADPRRVDFVHDVLRNTPQFTTAFGCRIGERLYAQNACKVID